MPKSSYARTLHFICNNKNDPHPHIDDIQRALRMTIHRMEPSELMLALQQERHRILIFDYQFVHQQQAQIEALPLLNKHFEVILINLYQRLSTDELLTFGHLKGLFYCDDSPEVIAKGCAAIINGENWLPRKVTAQLLYHYRTVMSSQTATVVLDITMRELEILRCLKSGASNAQIAEDLFISEFTVKSHLYQVYKKLKVRNRVQAMEWAKANL